jgi:threonine dehydratase
MIPHLWLEQAEVRIAPYIQRTELTYDSDLNCFLKWENHQVTGSFKVRGALNKVLSLQPWEREIGIVTASAGNHGQGVALAGRQVGASVTVFASKNAVPTKLEKMRSLGAKLELVTGGYGEAEAAGMKYAAAAGATWISPYNDGQVIAGQGTLGMEILSTLPAGLACTWVIPVGGGGLLAGTGAAIKPTPAIDRLPSHSLIGVQAEASPFMFSLYHSGTQENLKELPSLADGLSGPVETHSLTISLTKAYIDDFLLISERDISRAIAYAWEHYSEKIEGSAAVALAAVLSKAVKNRPAVIIISGGNIQAEIHDKIVKELAAPA